jgi:AcrR family transcriptional regulator
MSKSVKLDNEVRRRSAPSDLDYSSHARSCAPPGLRQRKQQRIRQQLTDAAFRLFTTRGFDATSIDDIVDTVEVSRRTFFRYFGSKEQVVLAWLDQMGKDLRAELARRHADAHAFTALRKVLTTLAQQYAANRKRTFAIAKLIKETPPIRAHHREKLASWERGFAEELAARFGAHPNREMLPRLIASIGVNTLQIAVETWVAGAGRGNLGAMVDEAFSIVEHGLSFAPTARAPESLESAPATLDRKASGSR